MGFVVLRPGLLTTIQDTGRKNVGKFGIATGGAMDSYSLRMANLLLGNPPSAPALEITLVGPELEAQQEHWISICGGDLSPTIDGKPVSLWRPIRIKKGQILRFGSCVSGFRTYLAVNGGFSVPPVLKGKGTDLRGKMGGFHGRALCKGDELPVVQVKQKPLHSFRLGEEWIPHWQESSTIRVIPGNEFTSFTQQSQRDFFTDVFQVTPQSDRMGYRLQARDGSPLLRHQQKDVISSGVVRGTIQVPPDGQPIVLMADCQTIGGYPRIGVVATVDLPKMAQCKPGDYVTFKEITLEQAQELYMTQERSLRILGMYLERKWRKEMCIQ